MIIARSPFRITLGGGGTDIPSYYREKGGFVFAMSIDKYIYVLVNPTPVDRRIRLQYLQSEIVENASCLRHPLAREALKMHNIMYALEITSIADLPARSGLGSSGSYLVAMLTAIHAYKHTPISLHDLAEEACKIEIEILHEPVGKQDQYMATFGGLRTLTIDQNGVVTVKPVVISPGAIYEFIANTHVYYTGIERSASEILEKPNNAIEHQEHSEHYKITEAFDEIKELGYKIVNAVQSENFDDFGTLLDKHWKHKKAISDRISLMKIDALYDHVKKEYGVLGGKLIGAGGGGFLMLYCPRNHKQLSDFMEQRGMPRLHYNIEFQGAKIIADLSGSHDIMINHEDK